MRNIFILYMPPGNSEAMVHYEDTIKRRVSQDRIFSRVDASTRAQLVQVFGDHPVAVWGSNDSPANRAKFDRMMPGDEVLIVEGPTVKLLGRVAAKTVNPALSRELWHNLRGGSTEGWDLIYFIANPREVGVPFHVVKRLIGYKEEFQLRGFTAISEDKLEAFYAVYDDLYSILIAEKAGTPIKRVPDELGSIVQESGREPGQARSDPASVPEETAATDSEHLRVQWTLLRLGKQAGQKVWAPRGDQSRIRSSFQFDDFEATFAAGLDTQVKYLENIDVVWKEQFRIDAAFEVENSTSIYSGLLRFADLTMVAPNSHYPLFIVAPQERRNRVREQVARPTFQHLKMAEKVHFLSYDKVREIDAFFGPTNKGVSVEVFLGRSESLATN